MANNTGPSHGTSRRYKLGCRCPECRDCHNESVRRYRSSRREAGRPLEREYRMAVRACEQCVVAFEVRADSSTRFCSMACVGLSRRADVDGTVKARRARDARRQSARRRLAKAAEGSSSRGAVWVMGGCQTCGSPFLSPGEASRYCSRECRAEFRKMSNAWIDRLTRLSIYKADDWRCRLCGDKMSRAYSPGDPWSPTLDHIVPRSHGGTDGRENLRSAHAWCNSIRADARVDDSEFLPSG